MSELKERITKIIELLNTGIHERNEIIAVSLLAALSDQNIFLYGTPGTAKSLIARRLSYAFETHHYFEYLMQRFSTPEEVFGPVSISELKNDRFIRKTEGFLPQADFAFLDEIWKSSPAILNTLLTVINEKLFRNGTEIVEVPLKALIAASNETPPAGQGLEALYDRFIVRLNVSPMEEKQNFEALLQGRPTHAKLIIPDSLLIKSQEWKEWRDDIINIKLSPETLNVIHDIRLTFSEKGKELGIYVSDRRWQKAAILLKAAAFFCGRESTNLVDALLLRHCLWSTKENREEVIAIVENAVKNCGFESGISLQALDKEKEKLEQEIQKELYYSEDIYDTEEVGGKEFFEVVLQYKDDYYSGNENITFYISVDKLKSKKVFSPVDALGNEIKWVNCDFNSQGTCDITINIQYKRNNNSSYLSKDYWKNAATFTPEILIFKGDRKKDVNSRLIDSLKKANTELKTKIEDVIKLVETKLTQFRTELDTPFVPKDTQNIALESVISQQRELQIRLKDCERLKQLIG